VVRDLTQAFTKLKFSLTLPIDQPVYLGTGLAIVKETIGGCACDAAVTGFRFSFFHFSALNKTVDGRRWTVNR
jgi:hypothetical protein